MVLATPGTTLDNLRDFRSGVIHPAANLAAAGLDVAGILIAGIAQTVTEPTGRSPQQLRQLDLWEQYAAASRDLLLQAYLA